MTRDEAIDAVNGFLERLARLSSHPDAFMLANDEWRLERDILKDEIAEFAEKTFPQSSVDRRIIDKVLSSGYRSTNLAAILDPNHPISLTLSKVRDRLEQGRAQLKEEKEERREHLIEPATPHSAYVLLRDIIEGASARILMVDPYVDRSLFPLLSNVKPSVEVRILTRKQNVPADFAAELGKFVQQAGIPLNARCGLDDFHDRFLVIDDRLFSSGASFKDLGKKGSVVMEMKDIKAETLKQLEQRWSSANPV